MSSFRTKLIRLAFENPDLRKDLLPLLLKDAGAALKLVQDGYDEDGFKNLTPDQRFKIYEKEHPKTKLDPSHEKFQDKGDKAKPQKGKVDIDEGGDDNVIPFPSQKSQSGNGGDDGGDKEDGKGKGKAKSKLKVVDGDKGKSTPKPKPKPKSNKAPQPKPDAEKKVNAPKFKRLEMKNLSKQEKREKAEADLKQSIIDKYKDKADDSGNIPKDVIEKMNEDYSKGMTSLEEAEIKEEKKRVQDEKDSFIKGRENDDKKNRENYSDSILEKLRAKHGDDKKTISDKHTKAMKKYDDKAKKHKKRKEDGLIKNFTDSMNKSKAFVKKWLNPEDPLQMKSLITASQRVAARHESKTEIKMKPSTSRVAARHQKTAGGSDFEDFVHGSDARRCFAEAVEDARYEYGSGGYTGTIAEKHSFDIVSRNPMTKGQAREFMNNYGRNDKWGPAFAIPVAEETELARKEYTVKVKARDSDEARRLAKELIKAKGRTRRGASISVEIPYTRSAIVKTKEAGKPKMGFEADAEKGIFISRRSITIPESWDKVAYGSKRDAANAAKEAVARTNGFQVGEGLHLYEIKKLGTVKITAAATRLAEYQVTGTRIQSAVSSKVKGWYFWGTASS